MGATEDRHVETLREVYRAWRTSNGEDTGVWLDVMAPAISFRSLGASAPVIGFSRNGVSPADVQRYFIDLARDWEMIDFEVESMIAQGDRVAVLASCSWRNRHTGKVATSLKADFFRFEDGLVAEFVELFDTANAVDAATPA
jgi:ketosteroid isomerase-like protein